MRIFQVASLGAVIAVASVSQSSAQLGPAVNSFFINVKTTDGECCGNSSFAKRLPPGRKLPLNAPSLEHARKGLYIVTAPDAAPFPGSSPRSGFLVNVTAVGSNAHCFEVSSLVRSFRDLIATIGCVDPGGAPIDSEFSWSYRADSLDYRQHTEYRANFGYAQVQPDAQLGSFFSPVRGGSVGAQRQATGRYMITFQRLGTATAEIAAGRGVAVQVSTICPAGTGTCGTRVCAPAAWSVGASASTIDVRCSDNTGAPVDQPFRVFIGQEALNSQTLGRFEKASDYKKFGQYYNEGINYGWVNSSDLTSPIGSSAIAKPKISYVNKTKDHPGPRKIEFFHRGRGAYTVTFKEQIIYGQTYWSLHATTREIDRGTYCNIGDIDYKTMQVSVNCYDGNGMPRDARWFLSMRRLYN